MSYYYPNSMPEVLKKVNQQPQTVVLKPHLVQLCNQYTRQKPQSFKCM